MMNRKAYSLIKKVCAGVLSSFFVFASISCGEESGLGSSIDTKAPSLSIDYPPAGSAIRDKFILSGSCSDDKAISRVLVSVRNLETSKDYGSYSASIGKNQTSWQVELNEFAAENSEYFNGWKFPDGKYEVSVTAYDNAGNNSGVSSRQFEIDNTAPVFIISNPGVVKSSGLSPSAYGSIFTIDGTISDNHSISFMDVKIYDAKTGELLSSESYEGNAIDFYREEEISTAGGSSVTIAQYSSASEEGLKNRYTQLHPKDEGTESYYAQITLSDSAQIYQNPPVGSNRSADDIEADALGNKTSKLYLYDDVYTRLMSAKKGLGLSAANLKDVLAGIEKGEKAEEALSVLNEKVVDTSANAEDGLYFTLNPQANPTYTVSGYDFDFSDSAIIQTASCGNTLNITINSGLDNVKVNPATVKVWMKEYDAKPVESDVVQAVKDLQAQVEKLEADAASDGDKTIFDGLSDDEKKVDDWKLIYDYYKYDGSSVDVKTFAIPLPSKGISIKKYYILVVTGHDVDDYDFLQDKVYGFAGNVSGIAPSIEILSPENGKFVEARDFEFTGTAVVENADLHVQTLRATIVATNGSEKIGNGDGYSVEINYDATKGVWSDSNGAFIVDGDNWTLKPSKIPNLIEDTREKATKYTLTLYGVSSSGHDVKMSSMVQLDITPPDVKITTITPTVTDFDESGNVYINGTVKIMGSIVEQNLKKVTYDIWATVDGSEPTAEDSILEVMKKAAGSSYTSDLYDGNLENSNSINVDFPTTYLTQYFFGDKEEKDGKIRIRVVLYAEDEVGNKGQYSSEAYNISDDYPEGRDFIIYQETDRPKITLNNAFTSYEKNGEEKSLLWHENDGMTDNNSFNIDTEHNLFNTTSYNTLQVSATDDDALRAIRITLTGYADGEETPNQNTQAFSKTTGSYKCPLPNKEGVYKVKVEAFDSKFLPSELNADPSNFGYNSEKEFYIAISSGAPAIEIDTPYAGSYQAGTVSVTGSVSKKDTIESFTGTLTQGETTVESVQISKPVFKSENSKEWTGTVKLPEGAAGEYNLVYELTDRYGQTSTVERKFSVDTNSPTFEITEPKDGKRSVFTKENIFTVKGTISDGEGTSEIKGMYYTLKAQNPANDVYSSVVSSTSDWNVASVMATETKGEYTWTANIDLSGISSEDGTVPNTVYFAVVDNAGNISLVSKNTDSSSLKLTRDTKAPDTTLLGTGLKKPVENVAAEETGDKDEAGNLILAANSALDESITYFSVGTYSIAGEASDLSSGTITVTVDGQSVELADGAWTANGKTVDGTFTHKIVVTDEAGNSVTREIKVIRDTVKPIFTVSNNTSDKTALVDKKIITEENDNYSTDGTNHYYLLSGKWQDSTSGTKKLQYSVSPNHVGTSYSEGWSDWRDVTEAPVSTAETTWSIKVPMTEGFGLGKGVGLKGRAIDAAGNVSDEVSEVDDPVNATIHEGVRLDFSKPTISVTEIKLGDTVKTSVPEYLRTGEILTITGVYEDAYEVSEIACVAKLDETVVESSETGLYTFSKTEDGKNVLEKTRSGTFTIILKADDTNNGRWTFDLSVTDKAERTTSLATLQTLVDTVKPVWKDDALLVNKTAYLSGENHTWYKASSLPFSGAYTEKGSGIEYVKYEITQAGKTETSPDTFATVKLGNGTETFSSTLGEFITEMKNGSAVPNKVKLVAVDKAGNESEPKELEIYLDTGAPSLESDKTGSQYSNRKLPIEVTGKTSDDSSGVESVVLTITVDGESEVKTTVTDVESTAGENEGEYKTWKATIPATFLATLETKTYAVKATVKDKAGNSSSMTIFRIDVDFEEPTISNLSFTNTNEKYSVYESAPVVDPDNEEKKLYTYYVHNDGNEFDLYGAVQDAKSGVKLIELYNDNDDKKLGSGTSLPISGISFAEKTGSATLTLKATDNAGNTETQKLKIIFDNTPPKGIHAFDNSDKDVFFRISDLDGWIGGEIPEYKWNEELDKDIGGKYSSKSVGNNQTVRVRGNMHDDGSGVAMLYYKVISNGTTPLTQNTLTETANDFLKNYEKDNTGYFRADKIENKRVAYTPIGETLTDDMVYDSDGNLVALSGTNTIFNGLVKDFDTSADPAKRYATFTTNYDNSFTGFKDGYNYLILVAVDNVGNASLDSVNIVERDSDKNPTGIKTTYTNFSLNVDTVTPELTANQSGTVLTNGTDDIAVNGTVSDNFAGVKTVTLEIPKEDGEDGEDGVETLSATITENSWSATIEKTVLSKFDVSSAYSVRATVTDRANNSSSSTIFTIQMDKESPELKNTALATNSERFKVYKPNEAENSYFVNPDDGTFTISGVATDNYGVKEVTLSITGENSKSYTETKKTSGLYTFSGISLKDWTGTATATITVTDQAGNTYIPQTSEAAAKNENAREVLTLKFDTAAPVGRHALDDNQKDLLFRIGSYDNDDIDEENELWKDELDTDVGGKYSENTWGNTKTIKVRGRIDDDDSGVNMIYYKVVKSSGNALAYDVLKAQADTFLEKYKKQSDGYFAPLTANATKRVFFTSADGKIARKVLSGETAVDAKDSAGNTIYEVESSTRLGTDGKFYAEVGTNYDATLSGFDVGTNYLILVAVDNVGNAALDSVIVGNTEYFNASLNVDMDPPTLSSAQSGTQYTNGTKDIALNGLFDDGEAGSGVKSVEIKIENSATKQEIEDAGGAAVLTKDSKKWAMTVDAEKLPYDDENPNASYAVKAYATDVAGNDYSTTLCNIQFDKELPEFKTPSVATVSSDYKVSKPNEAKDEFFINNTKPGDKFTISGVATDNIGIESVELSINGKNSTGTAVTLPAANADASEKAKYKSDSGIYSFEGLALTGFDGLKADVKATLTVTDIAGNTSQREITLKCDTTAPLLRDDFKVSDKSLVTEAGEKDWFKMATLPFSGSYTEAGSGIEHVEYTVVKAGESTGSTGTFSTTKGTGDNASVETFRANLGEFITKLVDGEPVANTVKLVAVDKVGNKSVTKEISLYIDANAPGATADSSETIYTNKEKKFDISGKATDDSAGIASVVIKLNEKEIKSGETTYGTLTLGEQAAVDGKLTRTWSVKDADASKIFESTEKDDNYSLYAVVTDNAGNTQTVNIGNVMFDKTAPKVTLTAPTDADKSDATVIDINKTISLSGTVEDANTLPDNGSDNVSNTVTAIQYSTDYNEESPSSANWADATEKIATGLSITGNYTFNIAGFDTTKFTDNTVYYLRAVAVDRARNKGYSNVVTVKVNQRSDRPVLNLTNLTKNAAGEYILKLNDAGTVEGTVTDDDSTSTAVVQSITVTELASATDTTGTDSVVTISSSGDFTFNPAARDDGEKFFKFTVVDNKGTTFASLSSTTDYTTVPVIRVKGEEIAEEKTASSSFTYKSDNENPVIDYVKAVAANSAGTAESEAKDVTLAYVAGGTERASVVLTIDAKDANGIAGMTAVVKKSDGTVLRSYKSTNDSKLAGKDLPTTYTWEKAGTFTKPNGENGTTGRWELPKLDLAGLEGTVSVVVTPYDNSGLSGNSTWQFTVDNTGPEVSNLIPADSNSDTTSIQYNREVTVKGTVSDVNSKVASVQWYIPSSAERTNWTTTKSEVEWNGDESNSTLIFEFKGSNLLDKYATDAYKISSGTDTDSKTTWYEIPIYFKMVDTLGNISYKEDYSILFNPDLDKPVSRISSPDNDSLLGGAVRVAGSSIVSASVQSQSDIKTSAAYIQIGTADVTSASPSFSFDATDKAKCAETYGYTVIFGCALINELENPDTPYTEETLTDAIAKKHGFADKAAVNSWWGIKIDVSEHGNSCKINLNTDGTMNPDGEGTNNVGIRICGVNTIGKVGSWSDNKLVKINKHAPSISGKLYQFSTKPAKDSNLSELTASTNVTAEKAYTPDMFVKGQWYIEVTASETTGVTIESIEKVDSSTNVTSTLDIDTDYFEFASVTTGTVVTEKKVYIKVDPTATSTVVYKVAACDGTEKFNTISSYSINVDNIAPSVYALSSDFDRKNLISMTEIENSNYVYRMYGAGIDEGSKIDFLAVYFKRGNQIELPMTNIGDKSGNVTPITSGTAYTGALTVNEDNLYGVKDEGATYEADNDGTYTTITSSAVTKTNSFIRVGSLVKISGSYYEITEVEAADTEAGETSGTAKVKATFSTTPSSVFFVAAIVVNNGTETGGATSIEGDDGDGFADSLDKTTSGAFSWDLTFFSDELADGQLDIMIVAGDKAGNYTNEISTLADSMSDTKATKTTVMLTNHKPRVSKVFLATDLSGNGTYDEEDFAYTITTNGVSSTAYAYSALDSDGNEQKVATLNTGNFAVRNGLAVTFEMLGPSNGKAARTGSKNELYYIPKLLTEASSTPATGRTQRKLVDMAGITSGKINVTKSDAKVASTSGFVLLNDVLTNTTEGESIGWLEDNSMENVASLTTQSFVQVTIWDDVKNTKETGTITTINGIVDSTDSEGNKVFGNQYTIVNIPVYFDMTDENLPKTVINPFYWNNASDNSLYGNSKDNGHIELESDLPTSTFGGTNTTGEYDRDPKVSGKITLTGYAYDDQRLSSLWVAFDNLEPTKYLSHVGDSNVEKKLDDSSDPVTVTEDGIYTDSTDNNKMYYQLAYYKTSTRKWVSVDSEITDGDRWEFSVDEVYLSQNGHKVKWTLSIDTAKCSPIAATDVNARVIAFDHAKNIVSLTTDGTTNKPTYQMDVVPYITGLVTSLSRSAGSEFARSATGKYILRAGERIQIQGFNLGTNTAKVTIPGMTEKTLGSGKLSSTDTANVLNTIVITTSATSGAITCKVGEVVALNNSNKNPTFKSVDDDTITAFEYNSQANGITNNRLDDDVEVKVWDMGSFITSTKPIYSPVMKMDSESNSYIAYGLGADQMILRENTTDYIVDYGYNKFVNTAVAFSSDGKAFGMGTCTDRIENRSASSVFYTWRTSDFTTTQNPKGREYTYNRSSNYHLEKVYNNITTVYDTDRVQRPSMEISGAKDGAKVYMSYYDKNNSITPVKFRYGQVNGTAQNSLSTTLGLQGVTSTYDSANTAENNDPTKTGGSGKNFHIVASSNTIYKSGPYTAVGYTKSGTAVVAWYDTSRKAVILSWNTTPQTAVIGGDWQTNAVVIDNDYAGWYLNMCVDDEDGIHIAYYNSSRGDLKYAYIPKYDEITKDPTTGKATSGVTIVTVDSYLSVGTNITINVRDEGTGTGTSHVAKFVPYIFYYNTSNNQTCNSIKVAWRSDMTALRNGARNDKFTGAWECMTIPTENIPTDSTVCGGVPSSGDYKDQVVLGYMTDASYEKAVLK